MADTKMADIKYEDPGHIRIKPDPETEADSPMLYAEDPEDAGDLEFYDPNLPGDPQGTMYLARLPPYLWQAWNEIAHLDDDAEIELGKVRQWQEADGQPRLQLKLRSDLAQHQTLPKEYNLKIQDVDVHNTFLFSERDLAGYAAKNKAKADALAQGIPAHLLRQPQKAQQKQETATPHDRRGRTPIVRKSIPKKTAIAGRVKHEVLCAPLENVETDYLMTQHALGALKPKNEVQIINAAALGKARFEHLGAQQADDSFRSFVKTTAPAKPKARKAEDKYIRMPEDKLMDSLAGCFGEHKYWPLRALKIRLRQPEAWLREVLEKIAVLVRSGTFANTWMIKKEYEHVVKKNPAGDSVAAVEPAANADEDESDDDDEDVKMEDVNI
jgi:transcription initiation factor TFIIF subunit beta